MFEIDFHRALHRPGTLVDAGAHVGAVTEAMAALPASRVLAFEPFPPSFQQLKHRARQAGWDHVTPHQAALGAADGTAELAVPVVGGVAQEQWGSLAKDYARLRRQDARIDSVQCFTVAVQRLDGFELQDLTGLKIDVEGSELEVLQGAAATLARCRPVLSIEIEERHRPGSTRIVPAWLATRGYLGFYELGGDWHPIADFDARALQVASPSPADFTVPDPYVFTFYFVPPERRAELARLAALPES